MRSEGPVHQSLPPHPKIQRVNRWKWVCVVGRLGVKQTHMYSMNAGESVSESYTYHSRGIYLQVHCVYVCALERHNAAYYYY